ncbi:hypothetical protein GobsT_50480 [Gemmata obscuriglobus]|uniref:Uncharacterized protein n=1 Tax=Gemmata obscuriglobus TaxID=114 RepID=A0A2Z3H0C8_9BACT|nr:hypothetical protein [Gemmata obscuriglobus]AWM37046.1 hypothetical protein C1280_08440 [Gemmata obscuriglobus]QEG30245.1 hypothetical protein GobsT_50480 [Gemmata obscuriglobus]VTS09569.1 unnamed protein product [Gemmata obscuriglobus UQM 2246]
MTDIKDTTATKKQAIKPTAEAEALADAILRAAGSGLHFYSMAKTRDAILIAAQQGLDAGRARLLAALEILAEQADEDCPAEYRSDHFREALNEAFAAIEEVANESSARPA